MRLTFRSCDDGGGEVECLGAVIFRARVEEIARELFCDGKALCSSSFRLYNAAPGRGGALEVCGVAVNASGLC
jgi:hypothetical protein